jgi:hypothetical protein
VFRGLVSLLRSLDKFVRAVTINILLLRSLRRLLAARLRSVSLLNLFRTENSQSHRGPIYSTENLNAVIC